MRRQFALLAPMVALVSLAGCQKDEPVFVNGAYVRLNANPDNPAAGYFTIHGGSQPVVLRRVDTDAAVRLEMHESKMDNGVMKMEPIDTVDVPAHATVKFEPGGKHLMLWKVNPQAIAAGKMQFKFYFSNGDEILVDAVVQGPDGKATGHGQAPTAGDEVPAPEAH